MATLEERVINFNFKVWLGKNWKVAVFLVLLVCLAYGNCLKGDFVSDDTRSILNNSGIDKAGNILKSPPEFLRPLLYFIVTKTFGKVPLFYRLINVLFHIGTVLSIYLLVHILLGSRIALFSAAILAVHPIQAEAVSWISGGVYSQYSFFLVLSLLTYILSPRSRKLFLVSIAMFVLGLLSSIQSIIFPLIILLFVVSFDSLRKSWKKLLVFFTIDAIWASACLFKILSGRIIDLQTSFYQKPQILNPFEQIPIAITSYLELIFWPRVLTLYHSEMVFSQTEYRIRLVIFIIFLSLIVLSYKRNRQLFFWSSFFMVSLLAFLTPLGISWIVAERYVYLGAIGIFVVFALCMQRLSQVKRMRFAVNILFCLIISSLLVRTFIRNIDWRNEDNLWIATAKTSPSSPNTHNNLGDVYSRHGDLERAAKEFKIAIQIKPGYADAYHNLAHTYHQMDRFSEAAENYQMAIHFNPNLWQSYQNLAGIYFEQNKFKLVKENLQKAVEVNPGNSVLYSNLGVAYLKLGERIKAEELFQKALSLDPDNQMAKRGLRLIGRP